MIATAPTTEPISQSTASTTDQKTSPIEQAIAVRNTLRNLLDETNALITALKRQKQQSRLVQSTLQSLRQLEGVT